MAAGILDIVVHFMLKQQIISTCAQLTNGDELIYVRRWWFMTYLRRWLTSDVVWILWTRLPYRHQCATGTAMYAYVLSLPLNSDLIPLKQIAVTRGTTIHGPLSLFS